MKILPQTFYNRSALKVAQDLLGCFIVKKRNGKMEKYKIVETESYNGVKDLACHASKGMTKRNEVMFGPAGFFYVYFTYGMHYMLNIVTGEAGDPSAVLIRSVEPVSYIANRTSLISDQAKLETNGPAKLTKKLDVNKGFYGLPAYEKKYGLWIEEREEELKISHIKKTTRVGVDYAGDYKYKKWRFYIQDNKFVSKK